MNIKHADDEAMPTSRAARLLGVHPQTLRDYEARGLIESFRTVGGQRRFRLADVEAFRKAAQAKPVRSPKREAA